MSRSAVKAARSAACGLYHATVSHDEVQAWLQCEEWQGWQRSWHGPPALQVHHILGRGGEDNEQRSNLILVSACSHSWGHDQCPNEFRLACLYAKWRKEDYRLALSLPGVVEFDVVTLGRLVGVPLVDWLDVQGQKVEGAYREYAEEMSRWLRSTR